jgi:hypothetical protein
MPTPIWDQSHDVSGSETHRLTSLFPPPQFVKEASAERLYGDVEKTPRHLFADATNRRYPCHTPAATWMSTCYFLDKQAGYQPDERKLVADRLAASMKYWGIAGEIAALQEKHAATLGNALAQEPDETFALVWATADGHKERHWPLRNAAEVKTAAAYFAENRDEFTFADRHTVATKVLDAATRFGAELGGHDDVLEKAAGRGACAAAHIAEAMEQRGLMTRQSHGALSEEMLKLANIVRSAPAQCRGHENLVKFAQLFDEFDQNTNLKHFYADGGLARPEEICFQVTEKAAAAFVGAHVNTTTGRIYELDALEKVSVETYRDWLGDEFADAVVTAGLFPDKTKIAAVLPTMDRGMATIFDNMADSINVEPVAVEKAAASGALSGDRLFAAAARAG